MKLTVLDCVRYMPTDDELMAIYPTALSVDEAGKWYWDDYQDSAMDAESKPSGPDMVIRCDWEPQIYRSNYPFAWTGRDRRTTDGPVAEAAYALWGWRGLVWIEYHASEASVIREGGDRVVVDLGTMAGRMVPG